MSSDAPSKTVLLVESDPAHSRRIREMFNHRGPRSFGLTAVSDLAAAERHLAGHSIDVVLLALELPDAAGLEAVRRIHAALPRASIVLLCEPGDEQAAIEAAQAGSQDDLLKDEVEDHELIRAEQLRALAERLEKAREEERARVARDLHDDIGQILTAVKMELAWIGRHLAGRQQELLSRIDGAVKLINDGMGSVRTICTRLRPSVLDDLGLGAAIEWQALEFSKRTGIACRLSLPANRLGLSNDQATTFFRIFQECLTNISRHANAQALEVSLKKENEDVVMVVKDDGRGFREAEPTSSLGILGMKERAQACGGELLIDSFPGKGTSVMLRMPLSQGCDPPGEPSPLLGMKRISPALPTQDPSQEGRTMEFADRMLKCVDCSTEFVFTASEQLFFFEKGFTHDPKRCKECKAKRAGSTPKTVTETRIACSTCGEKTTVPFVPTQGRPVLCRSCFRVAAQAEA